MYEENEENPRLADADKGRQTFGLSLTATP